MKKGLLRAIFMAQKNLCASMTVISFCVPLRHPEARGSLILGIIPSPSDVFIFPLIN